jgi:hypothetical protein
LKQNFEETSDEDNWRDCVMNVPAVFTGWRSRHTALGGPVLRMGLM